MTVDSEVGRNHSGDVRLVRLCPAWGTRGSGTTVKPGTIILHSRGDGVIPFEALLEQAVATPATVGVPEVVTDLLAAAAR